jgi:hypothetical protein
MSAPAKVNEVYNYFSDSHVEDGKKVNNGYTLSMFNRDWKSLSDLDKDQIKQGIGDGTLTY